MRKKNPPPPWGFGNDKALTIKRHYPKKRRTAIEDDRIRSVPKKARGLLRRLFEIAVEERYTYGQLAQESGISIHSLRDAWRRNANPSLASFEAVATVLGYEVVLMPIYVPPVEIQHTSGKGDSVLEGVIQV